MKTDAPLISIIIPAYNVAPFLAATLDGIAAQTFQDWECVLVDDGSKDQTVAIARGYQNQDARFRVFEQSNAGPSVARNTGFSQAHPASQYVVFMDSDDLWLPDALRVLHQEIERHPNAAGAHGLADFIDAQGRPLQPGYFAARGRARRAVRGKRLVPLALHEPTTFAGLCNDNVLFPPGLWLARRSAYARNSGFDPLIKGAEDWDALVNLSRHGELRFINQVILQYRRHETNLGAASQTPLMAYYVLCKTFYSPLNTPAQQQAARDGWRAYQQEMVQQRVREARAAMRRGDFKTALSSVVRAPVHIFRCLRGRPGLRSLTPEMRRALGR